MHSIHIHRLPQQAYKVLKPNNINTRNMATLFYPRFAATEFNPIFRLMDDLQAVSRTNNRCGGHRSKAWANNLRSFQPRFDVKENKDSYELKGELPGVGQENIEVAFTDEKTLVIKGHTESQREEGTRPTAAAAIENKPEESAVTTETAPESDSSSYHKASVEEEFEHVSSSDASDATMSGANDAATPAETPKTAPAEPEVPATTEAPKSRYWVSERSTGSFSRTFTFPSRINQEEVSASLKDGILSIVVPKAAAPENRRIAIQ